MLLVSSLFGFALTVCGSRTNEKSLFSEKFPVLFTARISKKELRIIQNERLKKSLIHGQRIVIDFDLPGIMSNKVCETINFLREHRGGNIYHPAKECQTRILPFIALWIFCCSRFRLNSV